MAKPKSAPVVAVPAVPTVVSPSTVEPILTAEQLAKALQLPSEKTVYELTRTRKRKDGRPPMPALRAGKFLRFRLSDVVKWMETAA
jgi:predicted DNA-binding transcriptional regulator AlpA